MRVFRDLFWFFRQEKKAYITGIFVLVIVAFLETVPPKVIGLLVDHMKNGTMTKEVLIRWIAVLAAVAAALQAPLRLAHFHFRFGGQACPPAAQRAVSAFYEHVAVVLPAEADRRFNGSCNQRFASDSADGRKRHFDAC